MLQLVAVTAALAGAAVQVELPELFADELPRIKARTQVAVLLPEQMPSDFDQHVPSGFGGPRQWGLQIASRPDCGGAGACFVASFTGRRGGPGPFGRRTVKLADGRTGRFTPLSCGASCSPPQIEWRERGATYGIQADVGTRRTERRILVRMANEAIRSGPRSVGRRAAPAAACRRVMRAGPAAQASARPSSAAWAATRGEAVEVARVERLRARRTARPRDPRGPRR